MSTIYSPTHTKFHAFLHSRPSNRNFHTPILDIDLRERINCYHPRRQHTPSPDHILVLQQWVPYRIIHSHDLNFCIAMGLYVALTCSMKK